MVIKKVGPLSVAKVMGLMYAGMGLIIGAFFSLFAMMGVNMTQGGDGGVAAMVVGVGSIIIFPILYGVMGFIAGLIMGAIYNVVAGMVGGIEIETA